MKNQHYSTLCLSHLDWSTYSQSSQYHSSWPPDPPRPWPYSISSASLSFAVPRSSDENCPWPHSNFEHLLDRRSLAMVCLPVDTWPEVYYLPLRLFARCRNRTERYRCTAKDISVFCSTHWVRCVSFSRHGNILSPPLMWSFHQGLEHRPVQPLGHQLAIARERIQCDQIGGEREDEIPDQRVVKYP